MAHWYDSLDRDTQAVVRAGWAAEIAARLKALDLTVEFSRQGRSWVEMRGDAIVEVNRDGHEHVVGTLE